MTAFKHPRPHVAFVLTDDDNLDDRLGEVPEARTLAEELASDLSRAECAETPDDFDTNVNNALDTLERIKQALLELRKS